LGRLIGYARVSSKDQNLDTQRAALTEAGCGIVLEEKISGTKRAGREQLNLALKLLQEGDTLVVVRLDRLGRSMRDLANIAHEIQVKGAALKVTEQPVDTSTITGRAFFGMLSTFAEFETDVRRERQAEGIRRVKTNREVSTKTGRYKYAGGRLPSVDREAVRQAIAAGRKPTDLAKELGISRMSIWRASKE
jgi:DNA invertase Pin-like site-specific DNA recombinase